MTTRARTSLFFAATAFGALVAAGSAQACAGAGVLTRIDGQPGDVEITRDGSTVARPRVLEVICEGDSVEVRSPTVVTLSIDGAGQVRVGGGSPFRVASRSQRPNVASNAYDALSDRVLKDMKRQPWDVRLRGGPVPLSFGVEGLISGSQQVTAGRSELLVRVVGGAPGYRVTVSGPSGPVGGGEGGADGAVVVSGLNLPPGAYRLDVTDGAGGHITGGLQVVAGAPPRASYEGIGDAEARTAVEAIDLARQAPNVWAFESEQQVNAAPRSGLDRESVYRLIESYGAGG